MKSKSIRGKYNSSITRVRPLFGKLLQTDSTGALWLPKLFRLATCNQDYAARFSQGPGVLKQALLDKLAYKDRVLKHYGIESVLLERCFEKLIPPPTRFLQWLIQHPEEMDWPDNGERKYREDTQKNREQLMGLHGADAQASTKSRALYELEKCGATRSDKRWWAFEGCTEADLCLETDKLLLIVEGKRNEPLSPSTEWFSKRSQLIRNLEAAKEMASGRDYAVLVVAESELDLDLTKLADVSLPHYNQDERTDLMRHFLGCLTWPEVCKAVGVDYSTLPNTTEDWIAHPLATDVFLESKA